MAPFHLARTCPASPAAVWSVLTDFGGYGAWIPFTTVRADAGDPRPGWGFAGLSGLGPLRLRDTMLITSWQPPAGTAAEGRFRVLKTGRVLGGWAQVRVRPVAGGGTAVAWSEEITLRAGPLGGALRPVVDRLGARVFSRALDAMLAEAARRPGATLP